MGEEYRQQVPVRLRNRVAEILKRKSRYYGEGNMTGGRRQDELKGSPHRKDKRFEKA
jgi:hypothetical protein